MASELPAQRWSAAACCRFFTSQLAGWELCTPSKSREQARGTESGSKLPHSNAPPFRPLAEYRFIVARSRG